MKKVITTLAMLAIAAGMAFAQAPSAGLAYLSSTKTTKSGNNTTTNTGAGFAVGGNIEFDLIEGLKLVPGVYFGHIVTKGIADWFGLATTTGTEVENYMMIPVRASYGYELFDGLKVFAFMGPSFNYCLGSNSTFVTNAGGVTVTSKTDNFQDGSDLQRFDISWGAGAGFDVMDMIRIAVSYDLGMFDLHADDNTTLHRNQLAVSVSYLF